MRTALIAVVLSLGVVATVTIGPIPAVTPRMPAGLADMQARLRAEVPSGFGRTASRRETKLLARP